MSGQAFYTREAHGCLPRKAQKRKPLPRFYRVFFAALRLRARNFQFQGCLDERGWSGTVEEPREKNYNALHDSSLRTRRQLSLRDP
jgi:hypothetical protein